MKKLLIILLPFLTINSFAQTDTALGTNGSSIPIKSLNLLPPLYNPNDSTAAFDSSDYYINSLGYNAGLDSVVLKFIGGRQLAYKPITSGGGAGSGWKTVNTNDMTDTLSGNVAIGNGLNTPLAKLQVSNTGLGATIPDSSKGILLVPFDTATLNNQVFSTPLTFQASQFLTTSARARPFTVQMQAKSIQNAGSTSGYLSFRVKQNYATSTYTDDVLTIGINNTAGGVGVGINTTPNSTSGAVLNVGGSINQISGGISVPSTSTWSINRSGAIFLDFGASNINLLRLNSHSSYNGTITDKPMAVGRQDSTDLGAEFSVTSTGRGFLPPRMTTTQRDSINLQITGWTIINGGTGYTGSGTVVVSAGPVPTGATTASITALGYTLSSGVVTAITIGSGFFGSYNSTPTATFSGGGGTGLLAKPVMTQFLTEGMLISNTTTHCYQRWNGTQWQNLVGLVTGTAAPSSTPVSVGDIFVDTTNKKVYFATGTSSSSDWTIMN